MAKTHGRLHKLESEGQKREIIALWAYGYSYRDICRIMHEKHGVSITHPTVVYYAHADKWAAEREKAKKRADTYRPPIDHALTRQRRREKHWHEADEAGDAEQARKLLADAGRDGTEVTGTAAQATQVNINILPPEIADLLLDEARRRGLDGRADRGALTVGAGTSERGGDS